MTYQPDSPVQIEFGHWCFSTGVGELYDGETTTRLEPQVAKLLEFFLDNQNKVISRDELIAAVWENRIVSDDAINRCVSILRQTLSPDDKQAYIETVVRKGYLAHFPPSSLTESPAVQPPGRRKYLLLAVLGSLLAVLLYTFVGKVSDSTFEVRDAAKDGPPMVAVLPFVSDSQAGDSEFFATGVHNDLLTQLAKLQSIRVISATSVMEYRDVGRNIRKIGEELGADVILEGSIQIVANQIRINAQLIDARTDEHLWAESYDRELLPVNIFDVQNEIARAISQALHATLTVKDSEQLALIPTANMAAYRAFHRAMRIQETSKYGLEGTGYIEALEEAVMLDPTFSRAWVELVIIQSFWNFSGDKPELTLAAEQSLQQLQAVAPGSADHLIGQASYVYYVLKDYDHAHDIISRALVMQPSDVRAVEMRSYIERRQGDYEAYLQSRKEARRLDPRNPEWTNQVIRGQLFLHRYDEARAELENTSLESFDTGYTNSLLRFQQDRDYQQLQNSIQELCRLYEEPARDCGWEAHIANRDYPAALDSIQRTQLDLELIGISSSEQNRMFTYWLMQDRDALEQGKARWKSQLETARDETGGYRDGRAYIGLATLSGIDGSNNESMQYIQQWYRDKPIDWANRMVFRHETCRVLGMIEATAATVKCIRDALLQASFMHPFLEPYLPFYDSIRNEPEFIEMLSEIDGKLPSSKWN